MGKNQKKVRIFSALEVANISGVVNQTAINWIKNGYLRAFTTPGGQYRVYAEDLIAFLASRNMKLPDELKDLSSGERPVHKILIVDDDKTLNNLLRQYLEKKLQGCAILQALDGFEAGRLIAEERPALVLLDLDLPGINGHQICNRLKHNDSFGRPRILVMTGLNDEDIRETVLREGADGFMAKPLDFEELLGVILELLKNK